jgi:hypothetical protein
MYSDGALNLEGAGAGMLLISPQGEQLKYVLQIHYKASNNGAAYEALIHGLRIVVSLGIKRLLAFGDSKVIIEQVNKEWDCVKDTMDAYCTEIRKLEGHFEGIEFQHVLSYGPPWAHYLGGYQDRLLGGTLGLPGLRYTAPEGVEHKDYTGVVLR